VATMTPLRCPQCSTAATGPALHGTAFVLCPACWAVVAPPIEHSPPSPASSVTTPKPAFADELAKLPYLPRPRMGPVFARSFFIGLAFFAIVPVVAYLGWSYRKDHPKFADYTSRGSEYTVAFPDKPQWFLESGSFESGLLPSGRAERDTGFWPEYYQVRAVWLGRSRADGELSPEDVALGWATNARVVAAPGGYTAAEFEVWQEIAKTKSVGRVVVVRDFAYELTVTGRGISLADRRVKQFFDSFRIGR
jgi:hypothetical protein